MQHKKQESVDLLLEEIDSLNDKFGRSPTIRELCEKSGLGTGTVSRYLNYMADLGLIESEPRHRIAVIRNEKRFTKMDCRNICLLGSIPCGGPEAAEEYAEKTVPIPTALLGNGEYFLLRTHGYSMINAGIEPDDVVLVRAASTANTGNIVVALTEGNETTLKRLAWDKKKNRYFLQPENDEFKPIYDNFSIQGVVEKIIKDAN